MVKRFYNSVYEEMQCLLYDICQNQGLLLLYTTSLLISFTRAELIILLIKVNFTTCGLSEILSLSECIMKKFAVNAIGLVDRKLVEAPQ